MNRASRVKRGFERLAVLGVVPALIGGLVVTGNEYLSPSGEVYAKGVPSFIGASPSGPLWEFPSTDSYKVREYLEGPNGFDYELYDGRIIRVSPKPPIAKAEELLSLNGQLAYNEAGALRSLIRAGQIYKAGKFIFTCKDQYSIGCDTPFPKRNLAHIDRKPDKSVATGIIIAGAIWGGLMMLISWLIRGFMADAEK